MIDTQRYPWLQAPRYRAVRHRIKRVCSAFSSPVWGVSPMSGWHRFTDYEQRAMTSARSHSEAYRGQG